MPASKNLQLGEPADESAWRALVEAGLKDARRDSLTAHTADGLPITPLHRESDCPTANDISGFPGAAPFIRGGVRDAGRPWLIRQTFDHPDPERANRDILTDLEGGASSIELQIACISGGRGIQIQRQSDFDLLLAGVMLDAAPVALDAGAHGVWIAEQLAAKLKGAKGAGVAFNVDPIGKRLRVGPMHSDDLADAARFAAAMRDALPAATALRVDARPVHEAGGSEAQEIATALAIGVAYLRALSDAGVGIDDAAKTLLFTLAVGPDVLVETAKLRALRLTWARVLEASGAAPASRLARIHAVTSRRMMTRYDAHTNILRIATAAFAAAIGGAEAITTLPFTEALGYPTPFARRLARNTQHVLLEEARLGHVADPAGGSWFVEKLTRDLAQAAWATFQNIEARGGVLAAFETGGLAHDIAKVRHERQRAFDTRRETITGLSDFPLLGAPIPAFEPHEQKPSRPFWGPTKNNDTVGAALPEVRWASHFERLRDAAEARQPRPAVFFANLGPLAEFSPRANFARNLLGIGGVAALAPEAEHDSANAIAAAFSASGAKVAVLCGADARYRTDAEAIVKALRDIGCIWIAMAGMPRDSETALRAAGVDQFLISDGDAFAALATLHAALGLPP